MTPNKATAHIAGLLYLIVVVTGIVNLMYVPTQLLVPDDAAATVANIRAAKPLFGLGIAAGVVCYTAFLVLPLVLHRLLAAIDRDAAVLIVALAVVSVPMSLYNLSHKLDVLTLLGDAGYLQAFAAGQMQVQVMLALDAYRNGALISEIFWGLWLLPFGYLVFKSGFIPRVLGILLMLGCFGYLINITGRMLFPDYSESVMASLVSLPSALGEIGTCLWLLIAGVRERKGVAMPARDAA
jgi:hypothetical protein